MAKVTTEDAIKRLREIGGDTDEVIALSQDLKDTISGDGTNWEEKYKENDNAWRKKYMDAFTGNLPNTPNEEKAQEQEEEQEKPLTYAALFKEE